MLKYFIIMSSLKQNTIKGIKCNHIDKLNDCETCAKGKLFRLPFETRRGSKNTELLEVIHSDVAGLMHTSSRYFVTDIMM